MEDFTPFTAPLAELGDALPLEELRPGNPIPTLSALNVISRFFQEQQQDLFSLVAQDPKHKDLGFVMWAVEVEVVGHDKTGADDQHHSSL